MLVQAKALKGYQLRSLDGDIGSVKEFYFDDRYWTIRYLVANTGNWLTGRKVLISPYSLNGISPTAEEISVQLTKSKIEASPSIDSDEPVPAPFAAVTLRNWIIPPHVPSRDDETGLYGYYDRARYWVDELLPV